MSAELERLFREVAPQPSGAAPIDAIIRRARRQQFVFTTVMSILVLAGLAAGAQAVTLFTGERMDVARPQEMSLRQVAEVPVGDYPLSVAAGEGAVWTITWEGTLQRIDPDSNQVVDTIQLLNDGQQRGRLIGEDGIDQGPAPPQPGRRFGSVTVGEGAVWVTTRWAKGRGCRIFKVDPATNQLQDSTEVPGCYPVMAAGGALWVGAGGDDGGRTRLVKLDARTLQKVGSVDTGPCCVSGIAFAGGHVWAGSQDVANFATRRDAPGRHILDMELAVLQIDPEGLSVVGEIPLEGDTYRSGDTLLSHTMASDASSVWLTRPEAGAVERIHVERINAAEGEVATTLGLAELKLPDTPVAGDGWVAFLDLTGSAVALLDPESGEVVDVHETGGDMAHYAGALGDSIWVAHPEQDRLVRLDVVRD